MIAIALVDVVGLIVILAVCGAMYWLSSHIEPHWVSRDLSRFITVAQDLDRMGLPVGRRRDVRVRFDDDGESLVVAHRSFMRSRASRWTLKSKAPETRRGRLVYVMRPLSDETELGLMALRVPANSKVAPRLDAMVEVTGDEAAARREREEHRARRQAAAADATLPPPATPPPLPTEASGSPGSPSPVSPADPG